MINDIDLVEDDARVEHVEGRVIERPGENDVFEKLETIGVMDFLPYSDILYCNGLVEMSVFTKEFAVIRLVSLKLGII